jgi:hypothetical protein
MVLLHGAGTLLFVLIALRGAAAAYQLAFFTPGINPADAISRNWIREMPNWRM